MSRYVKSKTGKSWKRPDSPWGGVREGAGRKAIGNTRKVSITLSDEEWKYAEDMILNGVVHSMSQYFRYVNEIYYGLKRERS